MSKGDTMKTQMQLSCRKSPVLFLMIWALSAISTTTARAANDDHAVFCRRLDEIFAKGYPQRLEKYFCSLGTHSDLGFRWAGTSAGLATGLRIEKEMRDMGLHNVHREAVPVDVFVLDALGQKIK